MQTPRMRKKMKVIMMMKVSATHMVEDLILDLMMGVQEEVLQDEERGPGPDPPDGEDPDGGDDPEYTDVKISRREADKVVVPPFPTVTHLDSWMSQCLANVLSACTDPNQEEWMKWLSPAFRPHPDIEALNDSGHKKFRGIDVKLGVAMSAMLRAGSDKAAELYLEANRKASDYVRSYDGKIIKGRHCNDVQEF